MKYKKIGCMMVLAAFFAAGVLFMACDQPDIETDNRSIGGGGDIYISEASLAASLQKVIEIGKPDVNYIITVNEDEAAFAPQALSEDAGFPKNAVITLKSAEGGTKTVQLDGQGALFTLSDTIKLVLDTITLKGIENNNSALVVMTGDSQLEMKEGALITGNMNNADLPPQTSINGIFNYGRTVLRGGADTAAPPVVDTGYGGGVLVISGSFLMSGGAVSGNGVRSTAANISGGGVFVLNGVFTMSGAALINGNTAISVSGTSYGGGVFVAAGTFTILGGVIGGNTARSESGESYGGGVFVKESGVFTKTGGTIYGSDADSALANNAGTSNGGNAVYVDNSSGGKAHDTTVNEGTSLFEGNGGEEDYTTYTDTPVPETGGLVPSLNWIKDNGTPRNNYIVTITGDETVAPQTLAESPSLKNIAVTIQGTDGTAKCLKLSGQGALLRVEGSIKLILKDITLEGVANNTSALVVIGIGSRFEMKDGATITGNTNTSSFSLGGGVCIYGRSFTMSGGSISGNTGSGGGGVYFDGDNDGTFTMLGNAVISGNTARTGGGVYVTGNRNIFNMSGDAVINGNTAKNGGGVYFGGYSGGAFTMSDNAVISGNTAGIGEVGDYGGGVYITSGSFMMLGGSISGNTTSGYGGGVYFAGYSDNGIFTMSGGSISGNTANGSGGGGVYFAGYNDSGTFTMSDNAVINGNTANGSGGGVYANYGTFTMSDNAVISGNTAVYGGGVCFSGGNNSSNTFTMSGGSISDNTASGIGGGVYCGGNFEMSDNAVISGNTAGIGEVGDYGGGVYITSGSFMMLGGSISGNTTSGYGGGVYFAGYSDNGTFTKTGGIIYGLDGEGMKNTAGTSGHAVYYNYTDYPHQLNSVTHYRNTTAGIGIDLSSKKDENWE